MKVTARKKGGEDEKEYKKKKRKDRGDREMKRKEILEGGNVIDSENIRD